MDAAAIPAPTRSRETESRRPAPPTSDGGGGGGGGGAGVPAFMRGAAESTAQPDVSSARAEVGPAEAAPESGGGGEQAAAPAPEPAAVEASGAAEEGPSLELSIPPAPTELGPEAQARMDAAQSAVVTTSELTSDVPEAETSVGDVRGSVEHPLEQLAAEGAQAVATTFDDRPAPSPEIEEFCDNVRRVIEEKRPVDEDALVHADPEEAAGEAGQQVRGSVEGEVQGVEGEYAGMEGDPTPTAANATTPVPETPGTVAGPAINAQGAAPDAVPEEDIDLQADVDNANAQIDEAGMTTEPAQLVQEGPIAESRDASGELEQTAEEDVARVIAEQAEAIANARGDMAALQAAAEEALAASRTTNVSGASLQQAIMSGDESAMRVAAGAEADGIFTTAQDAVRTLLSPLADVSMTRWETEIEPIKRAFRSDLAIVERRIEERHSGIGGTIVSWWDAATGLPDWVVDAYDRAESNFANSTCDLIRDISRDVNQVIQDCEGIIEQARVDIEDVFARLPDSLQDWATGQQAEFSTRLDGLNAEVQQARDDINSGLTERAGQAIDEVRAEIADLREKAGGLLGRIAAAIEAFLDDPIKFIIDGLLSLVGIAPPSFWALIDRIGDVIGSIADDPMNFANNLAAALGKGFEQFFDNFPGHLLAGFFDWLFSGLGSVGVEIPGDFSLKSLITFFLQLMGITWTRIRRLLAKHIGEENVALIEKAWEIVSTLIEQGPQGIFEMIKEQLNPETILQMILDSAIEYVVETLIKQVTARVLLMMNPAGAIVQAIEVIYKIMKWVFENAARIFALIETVVNGAWDLVNGNIAGMANAVEGALAKLIPPVIDFLAGLIGLGDLPDKVADMVRDLQEWVEGIMDRVIGWLAAQGRRLLSALGLGGEDGDAEEGELEKRATMDGEPHVLTVDIDDDTVTLASASPGPALPKVDRALAQANQDKADNPTDPRYDEAVTILTNIKSKLTDINAKLASTSDTPDVPALEALARDVMSLLEHYGTSFQVKDVIDPLPTFPSPVAGIHGTTKNATADEPPVGERESHHVPSVVLSEVLTEQMTDAASQVGAIGGPIAAEISSMLSTAAGRMRSSGRGDAFSAIRIHEVTHGAAGAPAAHSPPLAPFARGLVEREDANAIAITSTSRANLRLDPGDRPMLPNPKRPAIRNFSNRVLAQEQGRTSDVDTTTMEQSTVDSVRRETTGAGATPTADQVAAAKTRVQNDITDWLLSAYINGYTHYASFVRSAVAASHVDGPEAERMAALDALHRVADSSWDQIYDPF